MDTSVTEKLREFKENNPCACGSREYLQFHHYDPRIKMLAIGTMVKWNWPWEDIKDEIDKCIIMCQDCHNEYHKKYPHFNKPTLLQEYPLK